MGPQHGCQERWLLIASSISMVHMQPWIRDVVTIVAINCDQANAFLRRWAECIESWQGLLAQSTALSKSPACSALRVHAPVAETEAICWALQQKMAGGRRSQTTTPTSKRKTRGQTAAVDSKAEPDNLVQPDQPVTPEQSAAAQNGSTHATDATDSSTGAADSAGRSSSQDRTYSEQVGTGIPPLRWRPACSGTWWLTSCSSTPITIMQA